MKRDSFKPILDSMLHEVLLDRRPPDVTDRVIKALAAPPEEDAALPADVAIPADVAPPQEDAFEIQAQIRALDSDQPDLNVAEVDAGDGNALGKVEPQEALASNSTSSKSSASDESEVPPILAINRGAKDRVPRRSKKSRSKKANRINRVASSTDLSSPDSPSREWMLPAFWMACGAASIILIATISALVMNQGDANGVATEGFDPSSDSTNRNDWLRERESLGGNRLDRVADSGDDRSVGSFNNPPPFGDLTGDNQRLANQNDSERFTPKTDREMVSLVNHVIGNEIQRQGGKPTPFIDDTEWHHRVFDVIVGRSPNEEEVSAFHRLGGTPEERREHLVDSLLVNDDYRAEISEHWGQLLAQDWIGSQGEQRDRHVRQLSSYLRQALLAKRGLDEITFELITAHGSDKPDHPEFNPAASFVISHADRDAQKRLASDVSRVFMGQRLDCVQCHQQSLADNRSQSDFWQFNAFFRQIKLNRLGNGFSHVVEVDFKGDMNDANDAVIFYEDDEGKVVAAYPSFANELITNSGKLQEINRRKALAERLVRTADFRRVTVNRLWSHVFGVGMTRPVDEFGSHNPASHPTLLTDLANQLGAHDYQLESVLKWMVLSDPFRRQPDSSWNLASTDSPHLGRRPLFGRYYNTWSRPDNVLEALSIAVSQRQELDDFEPGLSGIFANQSSFPGVPTSPERETPTVDRDFANAFLWRTSEHPWGVSPRYEATLELVADSELSIEDRIKHLFLIGLSRQPSAQEMSRAKAMVDFQVEANAAASGSAQDKAQAEKLGLQDVWWTMRMSDEFLH